MIVVNDRRECGICKTKDAIVLCDGCEVPLCKACQTFDLWCYGCGHGDTKAFCKTCYDDIDINPYGGRRPE